VDSLSTNLTTFSAHGGKLIFYHGDSDPWFSPLDTFGYYKEMAFANGGLEAVSKWGQFYFVPGRSHCGGGQALDQFDLLDAIVNWVEKGTVPMSVVATGRAFPGVVGRFVLVRSTHNIRVKEIRKMQPTSNAVKSLLLSRPLRSLLAGFILTFLATVSKMLCELPENVTVDLRAGFGCVNRHFNSLGCQCRRTDPHDVTIFATESPCIRRSRTNRWRIETGLMAKLGCRFFA
jgi:hypothetical protein